MGAARFEGVDILDSLGQIMELHTQHYKDDFDMDKELIQNLVLSGEPEDRRLLWMSRPCGTYTLREWEVYLEGSHANKVWRFYHEQTKDPILAYALSVKDVKDGKVTGTIYPLDYGTHVERVKSLTCPIGKVAVAFEDGTNFTLTPPMWRICVPGWTASGMAWISCCGDLRTFRKQEETPLLSVVRHGRIFIGNKLPYRKEAGVCV